MKKIITFIVLLFIPLFVYGESEDYNNFTNTINNIEKTITLTKYNGNKDSITIPSKVIIDNTEYSIIIEGGIFQNNKTIKEVIFEDGIVAKNMKNLFRGATSLEKVDFGNIDTSNVAYMSYMFDGCTSLKNVEFDSFDTKEVISFAYMFRDCKIIKRLDLSSFSLEKTTSMQYMFSGCDSLEYLNISNFNTSNVTNMATVFGGRSMSHLKTIVLGSDFKIDNNYGNSFSRGTWLRKEDGKTYDAVAIPFMEDTSGTYTYVNRIINETSNFPIVTYAIHNNIPKIDSFYTDNPNNFEMLNDELIIVKDLNVTDTDDFNVPGYVELVFKNAVHDAKGNLFDLYVKLDNVHIYDINQDEGYNNFIAQIFRVKKDENGSYLRLSNYLYPSADSLQTGGEPIYKKSPVFEDVTIKILGADGEAMDGSYLFSIYDLDGASEKDINSEYLNFGRTAGYGDFSEGVMLLEGFDNNTLWMHKNTFLIQPKAGRITGTRADNISELSEFVIKGDSKKIKFTWNGSGNVASDLFYLYQPTTYSFNIIDKSNNQIIGAKIALYNDKNEKITEWISGEEPKNLLLNNGRYILRQIDEVKGYNKGEDIEFFVGTDEIEKDKTGNTITMEINPTILEETAKNINPETTSGQFIKIAIMLFIISSLAIIILKRNRFKYNK